ncbi:MAG: class I lanthipeptide [Acidobacteria bacterium]|nr:class I lanthipeptide [Acidobacteriota bacterium]
MKKQQKKVALDRETVRRLDREELDAAKGGYNYSTGNICPYYTKTCP